MDTTLPTKDRRAGRGLLWAGMALAVAAVVVMLVQFFLLQLLIVPWYVPIVTAGGAVLVAWSLARRASVVRVVMLVLLVALAALEWVALAGSKLPEYTGPAQAGRTLPPFQTTLAGGGSWTDEDLRDGQRRVIVFFRGRW